ncbi:MAG: RNA methyltransferase [Alphaproteobacteria bacterium]
MAKPNAKTPAIILVRPQMGENIGAAARAMGNFGFRDLRLVAPRDGWPNDAADGMAAGAFAHMDTVRVFDSLAEASADLHHLYATTARRRDLVKPVFTPNGAVEDMMENVQKRAAFVFGPERTGLENDEVSLCHSLITIPTNPAFSSLNLGQSVLLMVAAYGQAASDAPARALPRGDSFPVAQADLIGFYERLEGALEEGRFFQSTHLKPTMIRNIRAIFSRADMSDQEVRTLHGIVSTLLRTKKAAKE